MPLTSSFVVWLREIRYVWKPVSPTTDHSVKKHTSTSTTVEETVKEITHRNTNILCFLGCSAGSNLFTNDSCTLYYMARTVCAIVITVLQTAINKAYQRIFHFTQHLVISLGSKITTELWSFIGLTSETCVGCVKAFIELKKCWRSGMNICTKYSSNKSVDDQRQAKYSRRHEYYRSVS